jgi:peptide/nickel transport system substrate-binding protein
VVGQISGPKTFNAILSNESSSNDVNNLLYASLTDWDNQTHVDTPMIAKTWEVSPDGLTFTFHLRRGACFSDGHLISSGDVIFSFEVVFDPELHPSTQDLLQAGGKPFAVSAPDSYTVVIHTAAPNRMALSAISSVRVMPKHVLEPAFRAKAFGSAYSTSTPPESLVTSGAWKLKEFRPNERTVLTRNPYWFRVDQNGRRLPYLDEVMFVIVPDQQANALKFQAGEVDALDQVNNEDYKTFEDGEQQGNYTLHDLGPSINTNLLWFNLNKVRQPGPGRTVGAPVVGAVKYAWFSRPEFRHAVNMAIDRDAIIRGPLYGDGVKVYSSATPGNTDWYDPNVVKDEYDPVGARKLLASLGFKDTDGDSVLEDSRGHPVTFTIKTNANNNMRVQIANMIRDDLARIGLRAIPAPLEFNTLITNLRDDLQYDCMLLGTQSGVPPDPIAMGQNFWRPSGATHYWNIRQPSPETQAEARILRALEENLSSFDKAVQQRTWREMQNTMNEQCFVIYLPVQIVKLPVRNKFGNVAPNIIPHRLLWNIERVYVKPNA